GGMPGPATVHPHGERGRSGHARPGAAAWPERRVWPAARASLPSWPMSTVVRHVLLGEAGLPGCRARLVRQDVEADTDTFLHGTDLSCAKRHNQGEGYWEAGLSPPLTDRVYIKEVGSTMVLHRPPYAGQFTRIVVIPLSDR